MFVCFRLLLTRENLSTQLLVMSVVQLVILSAQEGIEADRQRVKGQFQKYLANRVRDRILGLLVL